MTTAQTQRGKIPKINVVAPTKIPDELLLFDKNYFNGMEDCLKWNDIYKIFINEYCYNPKLHQTCIPGIRPSYLLSFPSHH
jgi:hypothetical protein